MAAAPLPDDFRLDQSRPPFRWWLNGEPVATCWGTALSSCFPRGEAFFIESVRLHADSAPEPLATAIRAFITEEANHRREHLAFNRLIERSGYSLAAADARLARYIDKARELPPILNLAATVALEHFTAMIAHDLLARPGDFAASDPAVADLWRWHAEEEIAHKAVAIDTWNHATRRWSGWKRWRVRCLMMLLISRNFIWHRASDTLDLLAQDGIVGARARWRLFAYLVGRPGMLRRIFPSWLAFFAPGFHP